MNEEYERILKLLVESEGITLKRYLYELLYKLWQEGECFSGKSPFGDSGWEWDIYKTLINYSEKYGRIDEYGDLYPNTKVCDNLVFGLISYIFYGEEGE